MAFEIAPPVPVAALDAASSWLGGANGSNFTDLKRRLWFTLGALIIYRLGSYVPLPGVDPAVPAQVFVPNSGGILGLFDMFAGGALGRMTIFALGILPYISAAIIMQLLAAVWPQLEALKKVGKTGRNKFNQYTLYGAVLLCIFQSYGIAVGLEGSGGGAAIDPGPIFRFTTVITLTGGTVFLMWLSAQITRRGVGNGISLIICCGIVAELPSALVGTLELGRTGELSTAMILGLIIMVGVVTTGIVFMERAERRLLVQHPKRQVGNRMIGGKNTHLPLKLNTAGVIPPICASSLLLMGLTVTGFSDAGGPEGLTVITTTFGRSPAIYPAVYIALIVFFAFFHTAIVFDPADTADNLKEHGGFIPGIRPGTKTAEYLKYVLTRLTTLGAAYLALVCLLPEILISNYGMPVYFGGTSLLILVLVTMDTIGQINRHIAAAK